MVMQLPSRAVSLLLVCKRRNDGNLLGLAIEESLSGLLAGVSIVNDVQDGFVFYKERHPDLVVICGFESGFSEALTINIRRVDGRRHTGVIVMAPVDENLEQTFANNYYAGADDVITTNTSITILKSKIIAVINHKIAADELRTAVHKLAEMSVTDDLTGLANMRGFLNKFSKTIKGCSEQGRGFAVLMLDLDRFKMINDTMNHLVGSFVIKSVARIIRQQDHLAEGDYAARYGGDEYIVVIHGNDLEQLNKKAESIRACVQKAEFSYQKFVAKVTCSVGLCFVPPGSTMSGEDVIKLADAMLYRSKEKGRNQVHACRLGDPVDLDHVGRSNLVNGNSRSDDDSIARVDYAKAF